MNKKLIVLVSVLVFVAAACNHTAAPASQTPASAPTSNSSTQNTATQGGSMWIGTLKTSDNAAKGNLMLVLDGQPALYIHTSRDFSSLIGQEVKVSYTGTITNFTLINIVAK